MGSDRQPESIEEVEDEIQEDLEEPPLYCVLLHNDDYTTMQFVVDVLMVVFNKSMEAATHIMINVHKQGVGLCGVYPYEIAETKVDTVDSLARENGFPLKCSMERED